MAERFFCRNTLRIEPFIILRNAEKHTFSSAVPELRKSCRAFCFENSFDLPTGQGSEGGRHARTMARFVLLVASFLFLPGRDHRRSLQVADDMLFRRFARSTSVLIGEFCCEA